MPDGWATTLCQTLWNGMPSPSMKLSTRQADALGHIQDHCSKAAELAERVGTQSTLEEDWQTQYALVRCVEIIGEAAGRLGPQFQAEHTEIPWRQLSGMRNRLIHHYDLVNVGILWQTVTEDIPLVLQTVEAILRSQRTPPSP